MADNKQYIDMSMNELTTARNESMKKKALCTFERVCNAYAEGKREYVFLVNDCDHSYFMAWLQIHHSHFNDMISKCELRKFGGEIEVCVILFK